MKIIAAILEHPVIEKILAHLRLQARAPPRVECFTSGEVPTLRPVTRLWGLANEVTSSKVGISYTPL
jgi:hypothetical protein